VAIDSRRKKLPHAAFNPETGLLYATRAHGESLLLVPLDRSRLDALSICRKQNSAARSWRPVGHVDAIDPMTAERIARAFVDHPHCPPS